MPSWAALGGALVFGVLAARSWARGIRRWSDPYAPAAPVAAFARRLAGPKQQVRLERASLLDAASLSGLSVMFLGGAWLPAGGAGHSAGPVAASVVTLAGLVVFFLGFAAQVMVAVTGQPAFLLAKEKATGVRPRSLGSGDPASAGTEVSVYRDDADSYAQLRRYEVYIDGERVGRLRRGELVNIPVAVGSHAVQVRISWCSSGEVPVEVGSGERVSLICRAKHGARTDLGGVIRQRDGFLLLREV